ncbi:MAG: phospho-N-acetylmuramoyl-pentapeptide-transferase [Phycisphaeraceae bacterium]|nr:phospho-N-acetylmuramoyl-pentapeptide-transferase [Phycisphaerae bacterium]MBX3393434.1 phospho-N-acetylmuramoyl-pentapeptide-transferase [Phycisphaeraceae bacterium]
MSLRGGWRVGATHEMLYWLLDISREWLVEARLYWLVSVFDQVQFRALAAAFAAFAAVLLLGRRVIASLVRLKIGDTGQSDAQLLRQQAQSKANTPTMGGTLIAGAVFASVCLLADVRQFYVYMGLVVLVWTAIIGAADDWLKLTASRRGTGRQGLFAWEKLVFQLGIGVLVGYFGFSRGDTAAELDLAHVVNLPFQKTYDGGEVNASLYYLPLAGYMVLATLMLTGMSNAVNITDGMDGLAAGISSAVAMGLFILCLVAGEPAWARYLLVPYVPFSSELAVLAGAMGGACLGFLWWNCAPAQVFMGDTGSLCIGALIGYLAMIIRQEVVVLMMSGVFLVEIASVVIQVTVYRASGGTVGFYKVSGDMRVFRCSPFHHHLHLGGWNEQQIVARLWIVSVLLVVVALATIKIR